MTMLKGLKRDPYTLRKGNSINFSFFHRHAKAIARRVMKTLGKKDTEFWSTYLHGDNGGYECLLEGRISNGVFEAWIVKDNGRAQLCFAYYGRIGYPPLHEPVSISIYLPENPKSMTFETLGAQLKQECEEINPFFTL